jgi:threonylcarbamoyladenosine tRNA methylthiotransferase MtaB
VQERLDRPAITTDIIVGFPGETDAEFQETVEVARAVGFSKIHIFPFSPRRGTPAAEMDNHVPKHVQQERSRELAAIEAELREAYYRRLIGSRLRVLVEARSEERGARSEKPWTGPWIGTACRYATVETAVEADNEGRFVDVVAAEIRGERLVAAGGTP